MGLHSIQGQGSLQPMGMLQQTLMQLKTHIPEEKRRVVVCEVPFKECCKTYIEETNRDLKARLSEHKLAVKRGDSKDSTAVHAHGSHKGTDWDGPTVKRRVTSHWQRRAIQKPLRSPAVARQ